MGVGGVAFTSTIQTGNTISHLEKKIKKLLEFKC
jgi:hypothetical protein